MNEHLWMICSFEDSLWNHLWVCIPFVVDVYTSIEFKRIKLHKALIKPCQMYLVIRLYVEAVMEGHQPWAAGAAATRWTPHPMKWGHWWWGWWLMTQRLNGCWMGGDSEVEGPVWSRHEPTKGRQRSTSENKGQQQDDGWQWSLLLWLLDR